MPPPRPSGSFPEVYEISVSARSPHRLTTTAARLVGHMAISAAILVRHWSHLPSVDRGHQLLTALLLDVALDPAGIQEWPG